MKQGNGPMKKRNQEGVSWLDDLLGKILVYQANREIYPTFESYYFEILDTFKDNEKIYYSF
jgi:hypothetical protein